MDNSVSSALEQWEEHLHSFVYIPDNLHSGPNTPAVNYVDTSRRTVDLSALTVGVKDIIDVQGMPTCNGSEVCSQATPANTDAEVVAALRRAGARIIGKTTTTEFAYTDPTDCRNPYDLNRSPGGSSSGSGAAVAAGLVDMALGTQTAGSLCRPAAYCGVVCYKPSYGRFSTQGVTPLAKSFDTVGIIARSVAVARQGAQAMGLPESTTAQSKSRLASVLLPTNVLAKPEALDAFTDAFRALKQQYSDIRACKLEIDVDAIVSAHKTVMNAEAAQAHRHLLAPELSQSLRPRFRQAIHAGALISDKELESAREILDAAKQHFWQELYRVDSLLTLPVPDGAPLLDGTTGYQDWLTPWTVFGGPLVCLPWGLDSLGRPRSIMLAGKPDEDMSLLNLAEKLEKRAPMVPGPTLPI